MPVFTYKATDISGRLVRGSMEAKNEQDLVDKLQEMGYFPVKVSLSEEGEERPEPKRTGFLTTLFPRKVSTSEVIGFTHELYTMLDAGMPLDRALFFLVDAQENPAFREIILDIYRGIRGGKSLAACLELHPEVFSDIYVSMVRAGEASGSLEIVLARLEGFMEEARRVRDAIRSALIYPSLLTVVGGGAVAVLLFFVIPRFSVIFLEMENMLPLPTRILLAVSEGVVRYWWIGLGLFVIVFLVLRSLIQTERGRLYFDGLKLRVPLFGRLYHKAIISRFLRTLGTLLNGGIPIIDALNIARDTMGNRQMILAMDPVIEGVRRGRGFSAPLKESGLFPQLAVHMLTVGEESGRLDEMLFKLADNYEHDINIAIKRFVSLIEPSLILVMAIIVGFIVMSLLLAIFSINEVTI